MNPQTALKARRQMNGIVAVSASEYDVPGDHGTYRVRLDADGARCPCDARTHCSHERALTWWLESNKHLAAVAEASPRSQETSMTQTSTNGAALATRTEKLANPSDATSAVGMPKAYSLDEIFRIGEHFAASGLFKNGNQASQAFAKILAGQELGIGPMASMSSIHFVEGKATLDATLVGSMIKRSGRYDYRIRKSDDQSCLIEFFERGEALGTAEFTMEDAKRAQLATKDVWKKYPVNMLRARSMTNGARMYCPDVFNGAVYTAEEMGARVNVTDDGKTVVEESVSTARVMSEGVRRRLFAALTSANITNEVGRMKLARDLGIECQSYREIDDPDAETIIAHLDAGLRSTTKIARPSPRVEEITSLVAELKASRIGGDGSATDEGIRWINAVVKRESSGQPPATKYNDLTIDEAKFLRVELRDMLATEDALNDYVPPAEGAADEAAR